MQTPSIPTNGSNICIDTRKKEVIGNFQNGGGGRLSTERRAWHADAHDCNDKKLGKVAPSDFCDLTANAAFISVEITAEFTVVNPLLA